MGEECARARQVDGIKIADIVCAITPDPFYAVGLWYEDFSQATDEEVRDLLARATQAHPAAARERGGA